MKNAFTLISLFVLLVIVSCKKDPSTQITNINNPKNTTTTTYTTASYNITYHLWYPYQSISVPVNSNPYPNNITTNTSHSLLISLDSVSAHRIKLYVSEQYLGLYGGGMPSPQYEYYTEVLSQDSNVFVSTGKSNNKNILPNNWINDSLDWVQYLDLKSAAMYVGAIGNWDLGVNSGYVGIKIKTNLGNKYGWIKLNVPNYSNMTMEAQALNNNYGQYIQAGQTH